ncbi:MAG: Type 1 glutamine amidotransferase-like domain-containing protein [Patescibacteria group bacterium]
MKLYLSSFKLGNEVEKFRNLIPKGNLRLAYISNALDSVSDKTKREQSEQREIELLEGHGLKVEKLDLREYFNQPEKLEHKISEYGVIWVRGGNVFVLRQAMYLSGFDKLFHKLMKRDDLLYAAYSAGVCVLSPSLRGYELVDDPEAKPYGDLPTIWEGLSILDYTFVPHWQSDHPESADIDKEIEYLKENNITYKALHDGEVIIV